MLAFFLFLSPLVTNAETFDIQNMAKGLEDVRDYFGDATKDDYFNQNIPLFGQSVNQLWSNNETGTIDELWDLTGFVGFVENNLGKSNLSAVEIRQQMEVYLQTDTVAMNLHTNGGICTGAGPVFAFIDSGNLRLLICAELEFMRTVYFTGTGLFRAIEEHYSISADMPTDIPVKLALAIQIDVVSTNPNSPTVEMGTVAADVDFDLNPSLLLGLGAATLSAETQAQVLAEFKLGFCAISLPASSCPAAFPGFTDLADNARHYFYRSMAIDLQGTLSSGMELPGLDVGTEGTFSIVESNAFEPKPDVTVNNIALKDDLLRFSLTNCLSFLRKIDSAIVRTQEQQVMQNNVPYTDKTFASLLATGQILSSQLLELFARVEPFIERSILSVIMTGEGVEDEMVLNTTVLELYLVEDELVANPYDHAAVREASTSICKLHFLSDEPVTTDAELVVAMVTAINDADCDIQACNAHDCSYHTETESYYCSLDCQVVFDTNDNGQALMASVPYHDFQRSEKQDIQLMGLYQQPEDIKGETSLLGLPLNQPFMPNLIPRFRNFEEMALLVKQGLGEWGMVDLVVTTVFVTENDVPRYEINLEFTRLEEFNVGFRGDDGVGGESYAVKSLMVN